MRIKQLNEIKRQCKKDHEHVHLMEGKAKEAAIYPPALCAEICMGLKEQKAYDKQGTICSIALTTDDLTDTLRLLISDAVDGRQGHDRTDRDK